MRLELFSLKSEILLACWLAFLQELTKAYTIESMSVACASGYGSRKQIRLSARGPTAGASLLIDVAGRGLEPRSCGVDVHVPNTHVIALRLVHDSSEARDYQEDEASHSPCPLAIYTLAKGRRLPRRHLRSVDLCNAHAVAHFSVLLPRQHVSLIWMPPHGNYSRRLHASEVIVTAIGNGFEVCNTTPRHMYVPCISWFSSYCVARELVCDGRENCPGLGGDEDPVLCAALGFGGLPPGATARRKNVTNTSPTILHVVSSTDVTKHVTHLVNISAASADDEVSFASALSQYGPWGFVMLGMLICGSVLMVCGVWECICRRSKLNPTEAPPATQGPPFVLNPDGYTWNVTPMPPSYDDLDQPPAYNILFPQLASKNGTSDEGVSAEVGCSQQRY